MILNSFPSTLKSLLPTLLSLASSHLVSLAPIYHASYLASTSDALVPTNFEDDSDVPSDLPGLVAIILDFVTQAARRKTVKGLFVHEGRAGELLESAMDSAIGFARMTTDDVSVFLVFFCGGGRAADGSDVGGELGERP